MEPRGGGTSASSSTVVLVPLLTGSGLVTWPNQTRVQVRRRTISSASGSGNGARIGARIMLVVLEIMRVELEIVPALLEIMLMVHTRPTPKSCLVKSSTRHVVFH